MKEQFSTPVIGIGATVETENGLATIVGIKANAIVSPTGYRRVIPYVVLQNSNGNTFEVAASVFESLV
jgi:hypothetical protein